MISAATGGSEGKPAPPLPGAPGGGGGPPPKLTSRITGTGFVAAAGVYNVSLICGASGALPIDPVIFFITAAPSRALRVRLGHLPCHGRRLRRQAAVDLGLVHPENLGTTLLDPGLTVADRRAVGEHERIGKREGRDLGLVVVRDVTRLQRAAQRVAVRIGSQVRRRRRRRRLLTRAARSTPAPEVAAHRASALKRLPLLPPRTKPSAFTPSLPLCRGNRWTLLRSC